MGNVFAASTLESNNQESQSESTFTVEAKYAETFLTKIGYPSAVSNPVKLYNVLDDLEAVYFKIQKGGYIIVNVNDLSIPELSLKADLNFINSSSKILYNGPLAYFTKTKDGIYSLRSGKKVDVFEKVYSHSKKDKDKILIKLQNEFSPQGTGTEEYISGPDLKTWDEPTGNCGSIAAAITLMYYDEQYNDNIVDDSNENEDFVDVLIPYIEGDAPGSTTSELKNGINDYLSDMMISDYEATSTTSFSFSRIQSNIGYDRPTIVDTDNDPTFGEHWLICYGYFDGTMEGDDYIIVNNGWGDNDIWVNIDDSNLDDLVYLI